MFILNISVLTFLIGLGLFSYSIYDRSVNLVKEELDGSVKNLNLTNDLNMEVISNKDENLSDLKKNLESELSKKKLEIEEVDSLKNQLNQKISLLNLSKDQLESDLFELKLEISKKKLSLLKDQPQNKQKKEVSKIENNYPELQENKTLISQIQQKDSVIAELENRIKVLKENSKQLEDDKIKTLKAEFDNLKENSEIYQKTNKKYEQTIRKQKEQIIELKSAKLILEKQIKGQTKDNTPQNKSDGIIATFTGNLLYEPNKKRIILISLDGTEYTILQDEFPGDLVAKCGLPITTSSKDRCNVTILAELKVKGDELILKGKEIKEIKKNK